MGSTRAALPKPAAAPAATLARPGAGAPRPRRKIEAHDLGSPEALPLPPGFSLGELPPPRDLWGARLQRKAVVGPADDAFEREADRLAAAVTADVGGRPPVIGAPAPAAAPSAPAPAAVAPVSAPAAAPPSPAEAGALEEPGERELEEGGEALPGHIRTFFEGRLGYDFSRVRIHRGPEAEARAASLDAHAFTWRDHVWLGAGAPLDRGFVLAHELVHVVQQTRPEAAPSAVQRKAYWQGKVGVGSKGREAHSLILPEMGKENAIFTEAPIPNANTVGLGAADYNLRGAADLFSGKDSAGVDRTIGVYYKYPGSPVTLPSWKDTQFGGAKVAHKSISRPKKGTGDSVTDVDEAPVKIGLADLKPPAGSLEALAGPRQLGLYQQGIELARKETNALSASGHASPAGATWNPNVYNMTGLKVPAMFKAPSGTGQTSRELYLVDGRATLHPKQKVLGKIYVGESGGGIYNYTWAPDSFTVPKLGLEVVRLYDGIYSDLIVKATSIQTLRRRGRPAIQRKKTAPTQDKFDYPKYKQDVTKYTQQYNQIRTTGEWKDARTERAAVEAQKAAHDQVSDVPEPPSSAREDVGKINKIELWTGKSAEAIGFFRKTFGGLFVKVLQFYDKAREKLKGLFKNKPNSGGGKSGLLGSVIKFAIRVIKAASRMLVDRTADELMGSFQRGATDWIRSLIPEDIQEDYAQIQARIDGLRKQIEETVIGSADDLLKSVIGPYEGLVKEIDAAAETASKIASLINWVRWGARVIACLSPPAWGCLLILAEPVIDWAAGKVVETCWFQKKAGGLVAGIDFVRAIPKRLANLLIKDVIKKILPASLHVLFPEIDIPTAIDASQLECEEGMGTQPLTPEQERLLLMQERIGEERMKALSELAQKYGVPSDRPLTIEDIERMEKAVLDANLSASDVAAVLDPKGKLAPLVQVFEEAKRRKGTPNYRSPEQRMKDEQAAEAAKTPPTTPTSPDGQGGATPPKQASTPSGNDNQGGAGANGGATNGAGGVPVFSADQLAANPSKSDGKASNAYLRIAGARGTDWDPATPDKVVKRDVWFYVDGKVTAQGTGIAFRPVGSSWYPRGTNKDTATCYKVDYKLVSPIHFPPPNATLYYPADTPFWATIKIRGRSGTCP